MERFIRDENIRNYRKKLGAEKDAEKRRILESLLAAEEAKLFLPTGSSEPLTNG